MSVENLTNTSSAGAFKGDVSVFQKLNATDVTEHLKKKGNIIYLPWSKAWTIIKTDYPDAEFIIHKDANGCIYHTDGRTAWVDTSLTINGHMEREVLAVMDFKNASIPLEKLTSADVCKSIKRCLVKCAALHGLGLSLWTGEELSSAARQKKAKDLDDLKRDILGIISAKKDAGISKEDIAKVIFDITGNKNPNAIKDIATAQKVADAINKLEVKPNA